MCFDYDYGDGATLSVEMPRARKEHRCTNWHCQEPIAKGEVYERLAWVCDGAARTEKLCERCIYYRALIYAHERSEGCAPRESWCAVEDIYQHMHDLGWKLPSERAEQAGS